MNVATRTHVMLMVVTVTTITTPTHAVKVGQATTILLKVAKRHSTEAVMEAKEHKRHNSTKTAMVNATIPRNEE